MPGISPQRRYPLPEWLIIVLVVGVGMLVGAIILIIGLKREPHDPPWGD
jgi:hypothetical protein